MKPNICAPGKYDEENDTCFSIDQLVSMAEAYNRLWVKNPTPNLKPIGIKENKPYLLNQFRKIFHAACGDSDQKEICWTKQTFMNKIVEEMETFRPEGPSKANEWLSTMHINDVMRQYEQVYLDFKFLGAVPLNCSALNFCSLYKIDFGTFGSIHKLGIIFNHDRHGEPGSHWVALFINIPKGEIFYCDSTGREPIDDINHIINKFILYQKSLNKKVLVKVNHIPYQKDGSECGVYSCNFIIRMLKGEPFEEIIANPLSFGNINACRNIYFRNRPSKYKVQKQCD